MTDPAMPDLRRAMAAAMKGDVKEVKRISSRNRDWRWEVRACYIQAVRLAETKRELDNKLKALELAKEGWIDA